MPSRQRLLPPALLLAVTLLPAVFPLAAVSQDGNVPSLEAKASGRPAGTEASPAASPPSASASRDRLAPVKSANLSLPNTAGQYWMEYDIRPYTQSLSQIDRPQQAIIDWIIRDTGSDVWFNEPTGVLTADRSTLRVYHNDGMQQVVQRIYERFVNSPVEPNVFSLRIVTITNPNWRQRALAWMKSVEVESPGVHGWLLNKENLAMLLAMLRSRSDVMETPLPGSRLGQRAIAQHRSIEIAQLCSRVRRQEQPYPAYVPVSDEIREGYRLQFSPLFTPDMRQMDVAMKCSIDQVERLNSVTVELPTAAGGLQNAAIQVPQLVSWRLHERFRWPTDQVLVLSCGVIAAPVSNADGTLLSGLNNSNGILGLGRLLPPAAGSRADALLVIEYKGSSATYVPVNPQAATVNPMATQTGGSNSISRGRY